MNPQNKTQGSWKRGQRGDVNHLRGAPFPPAAEQIGGGGDLHGNVNLFSVVSPASDLIPRIREIAAKRRHIVRQMVRNGNACAAPVRRALGFDWQKSRLSDHKSEADKKAAGKYRDKIIKQTSAVIKAVRLEIECEASRAKFMAMAAGNGHPSPSWDKAKERGLNLEAKHGEAWASLTKEQRRAAEDTRDLIQAHCDAEKLFAELRKGYEAEMVRLAKQLPAIAYVQETHGLGELGFALIIGETGDLSNYANPAKVWKRMGMAVIDGGRQRKHSDKDAALEHGYNPSRRAIMWNIEEAIVKVGGPYRELYDQRKPYEMTKLYTKANGELIPVWPGLAHNRAKRYVGKRVLRDLWRAWRRNHCLIVNLFGYVSPSASAT